MTRRTLVLLCLSASVRADSGDQVWDVIADMAAALSSGNAAGFMARLDRAMPGYERLRANVAAITRYTDIQSTIDPLENEGDDHARTVVADWLLVLKPQDAIGELARRRERVTCKLEKRGRRWLVVGLEPQSLFEPPRP